ncbi:thiamine-phosphate kinase, partial [Bradyrhizobium guangdongense]
AAIEIARVPISSAAVRASVAIEKLVAGGDDYEILCTVPETHCAALVEAAGRVGVPIAEIGKIVAGLERPRFIDAQGAEIVLSRLSYSHF